MYGMSKQALMPVVSSAVEVHLGVYRSSQIWPEPSTASTPSAATVPSSDGLLSQQCCTKQKLLHTVNPAALAYLLQVFFSPEVWPTAYVPELQPAMQQCYQQCDVISAAVLRLFAAALGMPYQYFDSKTNRHHSNMQVRCKNVCSLKCRVPPSASGHQLLKVATEEMKEFMSVSGHMLQMSALIIVAMVSSAQILPHWIQ